MTTPIKHLQLHVVSDKKHVYIFSRTSAASHRLFKIVVSVSVAIVKENFVSSVRSSNSHPDLLLTQQHPTFSDLACLPLYNTDFHFLSYYSYTKAITGLFCWLHVYLMGSTSHAIFLCSWDLEIWHRVATPNRSI